MALNQPCIDTVNPRLSMERRDHVNTIDDTDGMLPAAPSVFERTPSLPRICS